MALAVLVLAGMNWIQAPEHALRWLRKALTLPALAFGIRQIALLGLEIWVRAGVHSADLEVERRILGLASAAVFIVYGNALPKILTPLSILPLRLAERVTSARRFVGTVWFALGVAMAIAFTAMPFTLAKALEHWSFIAGLTTIAGTIGWMNARPVEGEK